MDEQKKAQAARWIATGEDRHDGSERFEAVRSDGSMSVFVEIARCMGDKTITLVVVRNGKRVIHLTDPYLAGVAFTESLDAMVTRGGQGDEWYDTATGGQIGRPEGHDEAQEVLLADVLPEAVPGGARAADPAEQFLQQVVDTGRHGAVRGWDDDKRAKLVASLLARGPGEFSSERQRDGLLVLLQGWSGSAADEATQRIGAAFQSWPPSHLGAPDWLDWRKPDPRWRLLKRVSIRSEDGRALEAVETLVAADYLPDVVNLTVSGPIGEQGAALLAAWRGMASLWRLQLRGSALGDAGAIALARSPHLGEYREIEITRGDVGDAGAVALAQVLRFHKDGELNLYGNQIGDQGAAAFAEHARRSSPLRHLNLAGNRIGQAGANALAEAGYCEPYGARGRPVVLLHDQRRG